MSGLNTSESHHVNNHSKEKGVDNSTSRIDSEQNETGIEKGNHNNKN